MAAVVEYTVTYAKRRTLAVYVRPDGRVEVRAPRGLSQRRIREFVEAKSGWIAAKQGEALARLRQRESFRLEAGTALSILGKEYTLALAGPGEKPGIAGERLLLSGQTEEECRRSLEEACRRAAREYLPGRVEELARGWGFSPAGVSVTGARTRWGSCSGKNRLNFSFRLCYAPLEAVDYVILHELAHTREHNHSPRFWRLVEERMPGYRRAEEQLRALQRELWLRGL